MRHYVPMRTGDEYDALTRWRRVLPWRAGERAKVKRLYRRRERRVLNRSTTTTTTETRRYLDEV